MTSLHISSLTACALLAVPIVASGPIASRTPSVELASSKAARSLHVPAKSEGAAAKSHLEAAEAAVKAGRYDQIPLVGTDAHGHAYPGATVPFGMVQASPDTRTEGWDGCSGYHYSDHVIQGFSLTHLSGTGCAALGDIMVMPEVGTPNLNVGTPGHGYASAFSHSQELAQPGYYRVFLQSPKVSAELTATERCAFEKFTFPKSKESHIVVDLVHGIGSSPAASQLTLVNDHTLTGYRSSNDWGGRRTVYFTMEFSRPIIGWGIESDGTLSANSKTAKAKNLKAYFTFDTSTAQAVKVKVGISNTGVPGSAKNLKAELPGWNFDQTRAKAAKAWDTVFGKVKVQSPNPELLKTLRANLYLSCLAPTLYCDVDGSYRGFDGKVHTKPGFQNYTTFSNWDIYRAEWPLITMLQPHRVNGMVRSMLAEYTEYGQHTLPIWPLYSNETWCMIGYHSADMIAEAWLEGYRGFDGEAAYQAMKDTAMQDRNGLKSYRDLGWVASQPGAQATSKTLEYSYDDSCIAKMAKALGHEADAKYFFKRSANYRNLFDRTVGFFRGRLADGSWRSPFADNALVGDEYTEADAWQYAFDVQQDVPGMIDLYGGRSGFVKKMDDMFAASSYIYTGIPDISGRIGQYSQGDEQSHHTAYLYDFAGQPYKTQKWIREILAREYSSKPDGECGNVDCGQMAAWYVFSSLGFYPVNPVGDVYAIGSPLFPRAEVATPSGKTFTIIAKGTSLVNKYIQSATLNGKPFNRAWIKRSEVASGGVLRFVMGPKPNKAWGAAPSAAPPATLSAAFYGPLPKPAPADAGFTLTAPIRIACGASQAPNGWTADPTSIFGSGRSNAEVNTAGVDGPAPEAVYQTERYGQDYVYTIDAAKNRDWNVRLHFAEVFDSGVGERVENVSINGVKVLSNFDIFKEVGSDRAIVKEFSGIRPNAKGQIVIHIQATSTSPDQNAKISGIEVLPDDN